MLNLKSEQTSHLNPNYDILDEEGFLVEASDWTPEFTQRRAQKKGIELNQSHWQLIELIRDKYMRLGSLPPMRSVCKAVGLDKQELKIQFGSCLELWKMAGLPNPGEEAKSYMN